MVKNNQESWDSLYRNSGGVCTTPFSHMLNEKIREIIPEDVETILDAGCGGGALMLFLSKAGFKIEGVDMSSEGVRNAVDDLQLNARVGDLCDLHEFADNSFDLVVCSEVTEHIPSQNLERIIAELFRVSSKYVITTNPYREHLTYYQLVCQRCHTRYHPAGHIHSVDESFLHKYFDKHAESLTFYYSGEKEWCSPLFAELLRWGGYQVVVNLGLVCPVCGLPESEKKWSIPIRLLGHTYRATRLTLRRLGVHSFANVLAMATVRQNMHG